MEMDKLNEYLQIALDKVVFFLPKIVLAGIILWIGFKVVKKIIQLLKNKWQIKIIVKHIEKVL